MHPMLIKTVTFLTDVIELLCWRPSAAVNDANA